MDGSGSQGSHVPIKGTVTIRSQRQVPCIRTLNLYFSLLYSFPPLSPHRAVGTGCVECRAPAWLLRDAPESQPLPPLWPGDRHCPQCCPGRGGSPHPTAPRCFCFCVPLLYAAPPPVLPHPQGGTLRASRGPSPLPKKEPRSAEGRVGGRWLSHFLPPPGLIEGQ